MPAATRTKSKIILGESLVEYEIISSRRSRSLRLTVYPERGLVVSKGKSISQRAAEAFMKEKSAWILAAIAHYNSLPKDPSLSFTSAEVSQYKKTALAIAEDRLAYFNATYHFGYGRVGVRDQKTRWGSCSAKGNLNFNYRLALLPAALADYLVVHELCHVREMNHSPKFWDLVGKTIPDYKLRSAALKHFRLRPS